MASVNFPYSISSNPRANGFGWFRKGLLGLKLYTSEASLYISYSSSYYPMSQAFSIISSLPSSFFEMAYKASLYYASNLY